MKKIACQLKYGKCSKTISTCDRRTSLYVPISLKAIAKLTISGPIDANTKKKFRIIGRWKSLIPSSSLKFSMAM